MYINIKFSLLRFLYQFRSIVIQIDLINEHWGTKIQRAHVYTDMKTILFYDILNNLERLYSVSIKQNNIIA